jgi:ribosomal protein L7/L12
MNESNYKESSAREITMRIEEIKVAQNGFVLEDDRGNLHVAKTLLELAQVAGELVPSNSSAVYVKGFDSNDLNNVKHYMREGKKIEAIKLLRDMFTARLGLREAKDIVEILCS